MKCLTICIGFHKWCMACRVRKFKEWNIPMSEIHRFRTETTKLTWTVPNDVPYLTIRGLPEGYGSIGPTTFHNELIDLIDQP